MDRIVLQVFELALTQFAVKALPEIVQFGGEGFQLHADGLERKLVLPDIMPEDLSLPRRRDRRTPIRRSEIQTVEVAK